MLDFKIRGFDLNILYNIMMSEFSLTDLSGIVRKWTFIKKDFMGAT